MQPPPLYSGEYLTETEQGHALLLPNYHLTERVLALRGLALRGEPSVIPNHVQHLMSAVRNQIMIEDYHFE